MPLAARVGIDTAGGGLVTPPGLQLFVRIQGAPWAVVGNPVADHGDPPHDSAVLGAGSLVVRIGGVPVCRLGDLATCGDAVTGSGHVSANP